MLWLHARDISTLIRQVSQQTLSRVHHAAVRTLMRSFSKHPTFRISKVSRRFLCFSRAIVFLRPCSIWSDISLRQDSALYNWVYWNVYVSCLPCPRQLSRYSSPTCNGKLASFSAASCWCGVIWIWRYQCHSTACDGTVSTSDAPARLLRDQFIKDYRSSQVSTHWCFYERTCEREVGYKRLMTVCCRNLL